MTAPWGARPRLVDREHQLGLVDDALRDVAAGTRRALVVEGPAGIGKTALLNEVGVRAHERGFVVCHASGDDLLSGVAYGLVADLLGPAIRARRRSTDQWLSRGPARLAVEMVNSIGALADAEAALAPTPSSMGYSVCALVDELADGQPHALLIDDAHWADLASLRVLSTVTRRVDGSPVLVVAAARSDSPHGVCELLDGFGTHIVLPSLGPDAVRQLVRSALDASPDRLADDLLQATGGNPFLLHELLVALETRGWSGVEWDPERLGHLAPDTIRRFVLRRLAAAGDGGQGLARAVAVFGEAELDDAAQLAELDEAAAIKAADRLAAAEVLTAGRRLRFVHPLLRDTVRADIPPAHRAAAHGKAAKILASGLATPEQVSVHLLEALPHHEPWVVETLVRAASRARQRGDTDLAISLLTRALAEPPPRTARSSVAVDLGTVQAATGRPEAIATLDQAIDWASDAAQLAPALVAKARALFMVLNTREAAEMLDQLAQDPKVVEPELLLQLKGELVGSARLHTETRELALGRLENLREQAFPPRPTTVAILANLAAWAAEQNRPADTVAELAQAGLTNEWLLRHGGNEIARVVNALVWVDRIDEALDVLDRVLAWAADTGSLTTSTMAYTIRARAYLRLGRVADAESDARIAHGLASDHGWAGVVPYPAAHLADALLLRGALEEAVEVTAVPDRDEARSVPVYLDTCGRLSLARADPASALDFFLSCGELLAIRGGVDAPGIVPWRSLAATALVQLGDHDRARGLAADELALAEAGGVAGSIGTSRAALAMASPGDVGIALLEQAVSELEASPRVLARAAALVELGGMVRRSGHARAARTHLTRALDLATRCGATALEVRARAELLASGGRPRRTAMTGIDALTASERRVAQLATQGLSNREIAQQLYVSMRTIATHLTHVYQKLGVSDREQLGSALERENLRPP